MTTQAQPSVDLEILRHKLQAVTIEMAATLANGALAPTINEERDFAVAIVDPTGQVVALDNPMRLGAIELSASSITRYFKFDMQDGDVALISDPHRGTRTVHDWTVLMPLIVNSTVILHLVAVGAVRDIGGMIAGSYFPPASDVWGEGVPISPVKVRRHDRPVRDIVRTVLLNSRLEDEIARDLETLIAALHVGKDRLTDLVLGYGLEVVKAAANYTIEYTERRVRSAIAEWPDGEASAEAHLTHNGFEPADITVRASCLIDGDSLTIDLSASDAQQPGFVNSTIGNTTGLALVPLLAALSRDININSGLTRAVSIVLADATVVNAAPPAAVGWSPHHCGAEIVQAVGDALAAVLGASSSHPGSSRPLVLVAPSAEGMQRVDAGQFVAGRGGAGDGADGWGSAAILARAVLPSVEAWNSSTDLPIHRIEMITDTAGAGQWRGAPSLEVLIEIPPGRRVTVFAPSDVTGSRVSAGSVHFGVDGWDEGATVVAIDEVIPHDTIRLIAAGGAGFGDPLLRDPQAVRQDILDGLLSEEAARRMYQFDFAASEAAPGSVASAPTQRGNHGS